MASENDLLRTFIDSAKAVIYLKDAEGRFIMVNDHAAAMAGTTKENMIGKTDYDFYSKEDSDMFRKTDLSVTETGNPKVFSTKVQAANGEIKVMDYKFHVSVEGSPEAVGGIAIDVTDVE